MCNGPVDEIRPIRFSGLEVFKTKENSSSKGWGMGGKALTSLSPLAFSLSQGWGMLMPQ